MVARLTRFRADPMLRPRLEEEVDRLLPLFRAQPGFRRLLLLADGRAGRFALLSFWASRADAEAAAEAVDTGVLEALAGIPEKKLKPRLYEVHEPGA